MTGIPAASAPRAAARVLDAVTMTGGLLCVALGGIIMAAWLTRSTAILRFGSPTPMTFNTALAFAVTGAALALLAARRPPWIALAAGAFDAVLGLLALAEYALGRGLGIDQLFVPAYLSGPHAVPGRLAANTAVCFTLTGLGLLAWAPWRSRPRPAAIAAAGTLVGAIAILAVFGYVSSTPDAYRWGRLTGMALLTATATLVLAVSLECAAWRGTSQGSGGPPRWLPVPAGVGTLGVAAGVWLAIAGHSNHRGGVSTGAAIGAATVAGLVMASLVVLAIWLAQRAEARRRLAQAEAARRAAAEAEARAGEHRMFQFLDAMPVAVFAALPDGQPYYANQEAVRILGRGVVPGITGDQIAETYNTFVAGTGRQYPNDDLPVVRAAHGQNWHADDMDIHHPDGSVIPVEVWGTPIAGPGGQVEYAIAAFADMTKRNAREAVIASQAALLDLAHDAVLVRDLESRITYWNTGAEHLYGYTRSQAIGRISNELLQTGFPEPLAGIEATTTAEGRWDGELTHRCADGRVLVVESRWAAQRDPGGQLTGFMEVNRDITARKVAERELTAKSEELQALNATLERQVEQRTAHLERANRNLEAFAYSVAHDLRTPLRAMSGFAEALMEDYADHLPEAGRGYAERIQAASQRMGVLIDDLLHLSRVSRAEMTLEPVELSAEAAAIVSELRAQDPGRQVRVTIQPGVLVTADRRLIRIALRNLLHNAWKFSAHRTDARIEFGTLAQDDAAVCCFVRDNGAGFDPAYAGKLFRPFQRLHLVTEFPGTGIGLASVRQIVERHGGRTWAEGTVGGGATFYFTLNAEYDPRLQDPGSRVPSARTGSDRSAGRGAAAR